MYRSPPLSPSRLSNHMTLSPRVVAKRIMTKSGSGSELISCQKGTTAWSLIENAQPESPESLLRLGKRRRTQNSFRDFSENTRCESTADRFAVSFCYGCHCILFEKCFLEQSSKQTEFTKRWQIRRRSRQPSGEFSLECCGCYLFGCCESFSKLTYR